MAIIKKRKSTAIADFLFFNSDDPFDRSRNKMNLHSPQLLHVFL